MEVTVSLLKIEESGLVSCLNLVKWIMNLVL